MKPKLLTRIDRWGNLCRTFRLSDKYQMRAERQTGCMEWTSLLPPLKKRSLRCVGYTEFDIKDFTKMVDEFRTKNMVRIPTNRGKLIRYYIYIYIYIYIYEYLSINH